MKALASVKPAEARWQNGSSLTALLGVYGWIGRFGLTCFDIQGCKGVPVLWRRIYASVTLVAILAVQIATVWYETEVKQSKAALIGKCIDGSIKCLILVALMDALNRPQLLEALINTEYNFGLQLSYARIKLEIRIFNWALVIYTLAHFVHGQFEVIDKSDNQTEVIVCLIRKTIAVYLDVLRSVLAMIYFQLRCRYKLLVDRVQEIEYELDAAPSKTNDPRIRINVSRILATHKKLRVAVKDITKISQWALFSIIIATMSKMVMVGYMYFDIEGQVNVRYYHGVITCAGVVYVTLFILNCETCHSLAQLDSEFCENTGEVLAKMSVPPSAEGTLENIRRTIEERSAKLLKVEVLGLCEINRLLLLKILGAATTYVVLLIQYHDNKI